MRTEALYLTDIVEAADAISRFLAGVDRESFFKDEMRRSAVIQKLIVIGEAASRLSADLKNRHTHIEWLDIVGFRNLAVHGYFSVDLSVVWTTATDDVPRLRTQVAAILSTLPE